MNKLKRRAHFKKERSDETVSTRLWAADHALFSETVARRHSNPAELLRQIVHEWAVTRRLSGQNTDEPETAGPIRKLHEQILAEQLEPIHQTLAAICHRSNIRVSAIANTPNGAEPASDTDSVLMAQLRRVTEDMETALEKLSRLKMFTIAHYNLSAQTFAATWAVLDFIRRDLVEPRLEAQFVCEDSPQITAIVENKESWNVALEIVKHVAFHFKSSELFYYLIPERLTVKGSGRNQPSGDEDEAQ